MSTDRVSTRINEKLSRLSNTKIYTSNEQRVFMVHKRLRSQNKEAYEPQLLSIGPYHSGKDNLQEMEKYKLIYLKELLERKGEQSPQGYIAALTKIEGQARRFYADEIHLCPDDLVEMMLLDGCFIIELLRKFHCPELRIRGDDKIFQMDWLFNALLLDLLLIENQVPFFVLVQLHDMMVKIPGQQEHTLFNMALILTDLVPSYGTIQDRSFVRIYVDYHQDEQVIHLLDLAYKSCSSPYAEKFITASTSTSDDQDDAGGDFSLNYIKSTTELAESGVKFEKAMQNKPWLDITWEDGVIKIPHLIVDDHTECILRNLIAYEQYCILPYQRRTYITDYVMVMDLLINSSGDVEKLRHRQIIKNKIGDDEAVSTMFNKLTNDVMFTARWFCYRDVFTKVNKYSSNRRNKWRAHLMRNYFNTPWSIISFLAAVVLLILTFLQTIFTILM